MAEHNFIDGGVASVSPDNGINAAGTHFSTAEGVETDVTRALIPDLLTTVFDRQVVKMGWSTTPINAMTREMGYKPIKSMVYGHFSVDLRKVEDKLADAVTAVTANQASRKAPEEVDITVVTGSLFDKTDIIIFSGVNGYDADGVELDGVCLAARVCGVSGNKLTIQYLNAKADKTTIAANTVIYILGHAASETDASTTPYSALPDKTEQYMQKFMVQSLISQVMLDSEKEAEWGKADINELLMQQFIEDIEKTYIWGVKSYTYNNETHLYTRTTSGIVEQLIEGGVPIVELSKSNSAEWSKEGLIKTLSGIFVGNSGSTKRYMFTGMDFATALFSLNGVTDWVNANETVRKFEYDFTQIKLFNYVLLNAPHPLFDKCGWGNYALVIDRQYLERRVFRSMDETALEVKKTGAYDGESSVWSEISSVVLKYPKCHAIIKLVD